VRLRSARRLRDARTLGELVPLLSPFGVVRVHRKNAVNLRHVLDVRRRGGEADWEVKLEPRVNRVLPVSRMSSRTSGRPLGRARPRSLGRQAIFDLSNAPLEVGEATAELDSLLAQVFALRAIALHLGF
jgi:hypothetical protein